jgi:hypothetical protein
MAIDELIENPNAKTCDDRVFRTLEAVTKPPPPQPKVENSALIQQEPSKPKFGMINEEGQDGPIGAAPLKSSSLVRGSRP